METLLKETLLKALQSKQGVIGIFIIENGKIASSSFELNLDIAKKLSQITSITYKKTSFDYLIHESEQGKILIYNLDNKLLGILLSNTANPLVIHSTVKRNIKVPEKKKEEVIIAETKLELNEVEMGREILAVDTSRFPTRLDLILHLRSIYGADRFLATKFLEYNGRALGEISKELKLSVEAIKDLIARDPLIFSIKKEGFK
ncbi:MAG: hypothetical protein QXJ68_01135 [Methanocellales archaeon]